MNSDGKLTPLDLFNADFIPALESQPEVYDDPNSVSSPLLYVGIHNQQLYVQESPRMVDLSELSKRAIEGIPNTSSE